MRKSIPKLVSKVKSINKQLVCIRINGLMSDELKLWGHFCTTTDIFRLSQTFFMFLERSLRTVNKSCDIYVLFRIRKNKSKTVSVIMFCV